MARRMGEDLWYLLQMCPGLGFSVLFVPGLIWLRLILKVVEEALGPLRKPAHKFVHPLPRPSTSRLAEVPRHKCQPCEVLEPDSTVRNDRCA